MKFGYNRPRAFDFENIMDTKKQPNLFLNTIYIVHIFSL